MAVETITDYRGTGEARVELGTGVLVSVEKQEGRRNALVTIRVPALQHPLKGWADTTDPSLGLGLPPGSAVDYRIVVHRKGNVDKARPLADVENRDKVRDLVFLAPANGGQPPPPPVTPDNPERGPEAGQSAAMRQHGYAGNPSRAVASDARPWEPVNSDGRTNLSSYETLAACGMVSRAAELMAGARKADDLDPPDPHAVIKLAGALLAMADTIQTAATGGRVDRMASSHTRARGFLNTTLDLIPPPFGAEPEVRVAWREQAIGYAVALFRGAVDLVEH